VGAIAVGPGPERWTAAAVFLAAALLEVVGDAVIRKGLRGSGAALVVLGFAILGTYGVVVNLLEIDFSRLLGAYVGVFALLSVLVGRVVFRDAVPASTWLGLALILGGSLVIHLGRSG
jgi:drug/metabolite transporter superfamily protein YnfA